MNLLQRIAGFVRSEPDWQQLSRVPAEERASALVEQLNRQDNAGAVQRSASYGFDLGLPLSGHSLFSGNRMINPKAAIRFGLMHNAVVYTAVERKAAAVSNLSLIHI